MPPTRPIAWPCPCGCRRRCLHHAGHWFFRGALRHAARGVGPGLAHLARDLLGVVRLLWPGLGGHVFALPPLPSPARPRPASGLMPARAHHRHDPPRISAASALCAPHLRRPAGHARPLGGPWLRVVEGQTPAEAALGIFIITATVMGSHLLTAWLASRVDRWGWGLEGLMRVGLLAMASMTALAVLGVWPHPWLGWMLVFLAGGATTLTLHAVCAVLPGTAPRPGHHQPELPHFFGSLPRAVGSGPAHRWL